MPAISRLSELPAEAFARPDPTPDAQFYVAPRMVAHIDEGAIGAVRSAYETLLRPGMRVLDLMSSRYSHLPHGLENSLAVTGLGLNAAEMDANPALGTVHVQDLNADAALPFEAGAFDAATCCVSVQYLEDVVAVFRDVRRCLVPGAPFAVSFSNRCFPTKAIALWQALSGEGRASYVAMAMAEAGFGDIDPNEMLPEDGPGDPLWMVTGRA